MPHPIRCPAVRRTLAVAGLLLAATAQAQNYPTKPVRMILPFAGGTETVGRLVATKLSAALGQPVVPEPRVGATGNIGYVAAAKSPNDGYTLLMGAVPVLTNPHLNPKVGFDGIRDFAPVALLATIPNVVIVHPSVPARNMRELIALARGNPGKIAYGSGGFGSANHLAAELMQSFAKIKFTHRRRAERRRRHGDRGDFQRSTLRQLGQNARAGDPRPQAQCLDPGGTDLEGSRIAGAGGHQLVCDPRTRRHAARDHRPPERGIG